jgi:ketosteroid isomerase-like protein
LTGGSEAFEKGTKVHEWTLEPKQAFGIHPRGTQMTRPIVRMAMAAIVLTALPCALNAATVDKDSDRVIRHALDQWRADFNARRAAHICDLFAPDLRYDFYGAPERTYPLLCARLRHALADTTQSLHYDLKINEIIVSGNLAIVRLVWTSTVTTNGEQRSTDETGLDVFGRQPDGGWKIIRYIAYPEKE